MWVRLVGKATIFLSLCVQSAVNELIRVSLPRLPCSVWCTWGNGVSGDMGCGVSGDMGCGVSSDMGCGVSGDMGCGVSVFLCL